MDLLLQRDVLAVRDVGRWERLARMADGFRIIAEPRAVSIADAAGQDEVVVVDAAVSRAHLLLVALDGHHFRLHELVAVPPRRLCHVVQQVVGVDDIDQPLVADRT